MSTFQERIKTLRQENNLSQNALAEKIKSSQKIIDYWEKGASEPKASFIVALADSFGVTTDYLLGREDDFGNVNVNSDLNDEEKALLKAFRAMGKSDRQALSRFAEYLAKKD